LSLINSVAASPQVEIIQITKPIRIEFFLPSLSSIIPATGENIKAATSNDMKMNEIYVSDNSFLNVVSQ
jgi:hypothetical protein